MALGQPLGTGPSDRRGVSRRCTWLVGHEDVGMHGAIELLGEFFFRKCEQN